MVLLGILEVALLVCGRGDVGFVVVGGLLGAGTGLYATGAAVEAGVVRDVDVVDDGAVDVGVVNIGDVHVIYGGVVGKVAAIPASACVAGAEEAEAVVDAAVEADVGAPVAFMEAVDASGEAPVGWGPEVTYGWGLDPDAGNPVVAARTVSPVAGGPEVAFGGADGLGVDGEGWGGEADGDEDSGVGCQGGCGEGRED